MKRQYALNKGFLSFFMETDETTIKYLTNQIAWFKDWICATTRPISATRYGSREAWWNVVGQACL